MHNFHIEKGKNFFISVEYKLLPTEQVVLWCIQNFIVDDIVISYVFVLYVQDVNVDCIKEHILMLIPEFQLIQVTKIPRQSLINY